MNRPVARAALLAAVVVGIDQATKAWVRANVTMGSRDGIFPGVELVNSRNRGIAFNLLEGRTGVVAAITAVVIIGLLVFFWLNRSRPLLWLPVGLLLGGAVGNVIDRVARDDGVTDFVKLPLWPAFNIADVAITFGVLALFYVMGEKRDPA